MTGRANRLLHWEDIRYFKNQGFSTYDFGGITADINDKEKQAINKLKECFGGVKTKEYKSSAPVTLKGFLVLLYKKIAGREL
jgi:lipid II:glycine glycyltransferase (peptidoglycan interpeptide bridge formation enzyme)